MAKISEVKKVELLETAVLDCDVNGVKAILAEHGPLEFTAKALGLACRFCGAEMVSALIEAGVSFSFQMTPALKRKYDCKISISNSEDIPIDFSRYLFPCYEVKGYKNAVIADEERRNVTAVIVEKQTEKAQELLYYAILYQDTVIFDELQKLGVKELSEYRTDIVSGRIPYNRFNAFGRFDKGVFQNRIGRLNGNEVKSVLEKYLSCMNVDKVILSPSDFFVTSWSDGAGKEKFISKFCAEGVFEFFMQKTNMLDKVKKWDLVFALAEQNNASGMQYALNEKWISKPGDLETLLKYVQEREDSKAELIGYILEKQNQVSAGSGKKKNAEDAFSLEAKPLSAAEIKKMWGTKKLEDGTLIITSYKGEDTEVVIPAMIGKAAVTAIDPETFNIDAQRITESQKLARKNIVSVEFPGSIKEIPPYIFGSGFGYGSNGHDKLKRIILNEGTVKICNQAFASCMELEEIRIPQSITEIGKYAFLRCKKLKQIELPETVTTLSCGVFSGTGLETFEVPEHISVIEGNVFSHCSELKSVRLPDTITEIPKDIFSWCESLKEFVIPDGVTVIGDGAFSYSGLIACEIPDSVKEIQERAFEGCKRLKKLSLPAEAALGNYAFSGCRYLADKDGQIIVNHVLFSNGFSYGVYGNLSTEKEITPVVIGADVKRVASKLDTLPLIVYREYLDEGTKLDISALSVGDEVEFGRFLQNDDFVMKPLRWRVLAVEEGKALLITVDSILSLSDNLKQKGVWADSMVRKMLNEGFLCSAFTEKEREQIRVSSLNTPDNKSCKTTGGPDTEDRVFVLSMEEVEKYMPAAEDRKAKATEYAHKQRPTKRDTGFWQLRTPGKDGWGSVAVSSMLGEYSAMTGNHVGYSYLRPAIWVE